MGHYLELQVGRTASAAPWVMELDGPDFPLTFAKDPRLAELMLFDAACVREVPARGYRDLISDRHAALERFGRRLPQACAALAWDREACRTLEAFGRFFAAIDWPYVRFDTMDYR